MTEQDAEARPRYVRELRDGAPRLLGARYGRPMNHAMPCAARPISVGGLHVGLHVEVRDRRVGPPV